MLRYVDGNNLARYPGPNPISASLVWEYSRAGIINNFRNSPKNTRSTWINGVERIFTISFKTLKCESELGRRDIIFLARLKQDIS